MKSMLLRLFGIKGVEGGEVARWHIYFSNLKTPFHCLLFLLAAAGVAYIIWWFYKREPDYCSPRRRRVMAGCRFGGLLILLLIISGPVLEVFLSGYVRGKVVILLDASKSMSRTDQYRHPEDQLVAAHALGKLPLSETDANKIDDSAKKEIMSATRMDIVRAMFAHKDMNILERLQKKYDVEMVRFARADESEMLRLGGDGQKLTADALKGVEPTGLVTELGGAMRKTLDRLKGQPISAVVVVTDGCQNYGEGPALVAQDMPVRIFPIGIGVPQSYDVAITYLFMESKIFKDDLAPIHVRIKQHGFIGEKAQLTVTSYDRKGGVTLGEGEVVAQQTITLRESGEQTEIIRVKPKKAGEFKYKVEIHPLNRESEDSEPSNNFKWRDVDVIEEPLKVLVVEAEPRWEFRYLKNSLLRDKRVKCNILLRVPDMVEQSRADKTYLSAFPKREALFEYHAIVFGNIPNDGFLTEEDLENLRLFVTEEGGGIWFMAGKNNFPDSYKDSKLEALLPVEFEKMPEITDDDEQQMPLTEPVKILLTPEGRSHSITRLDIGSADMGDDRNTELWEQMPPTYWFHKAIRAKLGANVLLACSNDQKGSRARGETYPMLATMPVGRGRVLYQAFGDFWRMRYPADLGPDALERFHGHVIQYLGLGKLLGRSARIEINVDREEYNVGDRVRINARVRTAKTMDNSTAEKVTALVTETGKDGGSNVTEVGLTPEPNQLGMFKGELIAKQDGRFRVTLKEEEEGKAFADYGVVIPQVEMDNPDMKKELLENIAKTSVKGNLEPGVKVNMYMADQAGNLVDDINEAQRPIDERKENTLWDAPILLILFTLFMGVEWLIRKRSDLL
jgi:hypothetical protein